MRRNEGKSHSAAVTSRFVNPFRPGAGHLPPYMAGRQHEQREFQLLLEQNPILKNMILTGLRGVGKTVLLESFRPIALQEKWGWVGTDLSESASITEERMAVRILTDVSVFTSGLTLPKTTRPVTGFLSERKHINQPLNHLMLLRMFSEAPGLIADKLKLVLEQIWHAMQAHNRTGIVFAYDEAQNLADHADKEQYPLSLLLDVFQSLQRRNMRYLLVLTGLPTLTSKLIEARTYSERMFHTVFLRHLTREASREAILVPTKSRDCPFSPDEKTVALFIDTTGGYPYFIQFICKEAYDVWLQDPKRAVPMEDLLAKLDLDFFAGRWAKATERQRDLLRVVAQLPNCDKEFTGQEVVNGSKDVLAKPFSSSHVNQMLSSLQDSGLVYRNRHGRYLFAVPLFGQFIQRQLKHEVES